MLGGSSSSSHSFGSPTLLNVKAEPVETPLGRRNRGVVSNQGGGGSSGLASRLVRPKMEPGLGPVKREHNDEATFDDEAAMKWARKDWAGWRWSASATP